jgi:hypothetical protein
MDVKWINHVAHLDGDQADGDGVASRPKAATAEPGKATVSLMA